jgi:site-specific DNA-cytosine methylase
MYSLWIRVMKACGYSFKEFLLSPENALNIPNARKRYYFIAKQTRKDDNGEVGMMGEEGNEMKNIEEIVQSNGSHQHTKAEKLPKYQTLMQTDDIDDEAEKEKVEREEMDDAGDGGDVGREETEENPTTNPIPSSVITDLPLPVKQRFAIRPLTLPPDTVPLCLEPLSINEIIQIRVSKEEQLLYNTMESLKVPLTILQSSWAKKHLSIVSSSSKLSYCFTKGYGKIYDHSAGSCYLIPSSCSSTDEQGREERQEVTIENLNREDLGKYLGKIRLFHPNELLAIFGFPNSYEFPPFSSSNASASLSSSSASSSSSSSVVSASAVSTKLQQQYGCIGNSINVKVVQAIMYCLFEEGKIW